MTISEGRGFTSLLLLLGLASSACNQSVPQSEQFELKQDQQGRLVRLNKITGEVAIVDGTKLIPVTQAENRTKTVSERPSITPKSEPVAVSTSAQRSVTPQQAATRSTDKPIVVERARLESVDLSIKGAKTPVEAMSRASIGQTVRTRVAVPIFVTPAKNQTPLQVASVGSAFRVVGIQGTWYQVEWDDPRLGRRVGFLEQSGVSVEISDSQLKPVDLSIKDVKPAITEPVDISIKDLKPAITEPVDISIKDMKPAITEPVDISIKDTK